MRKLGFKLSLTETDLNLFDAYKKKGVFQPKIHSALLFIRKFSKHNHTQLFCWILDTHNILWICAGGWVICHTLRISHILGKKSNSKSRLTLNKEKRHETHCRFHVASNFCSKHKNPAIRLFYCKDKNPAILLTLVLALLLQKLSIMGGVIIHNSRKRYPRFQSIGIIVWPPPSPRSPPPKETKNKTKRRKIYHHKLFDLSLPCLEYFLD